MDVRQPVLLSERGNAADTMLVEEPPALWLWQHVEAGPARSELRRHVGIGAS
jgi:hypothetical protein